MRFIVGYIAYIVFQRDIQACSSTADVPADGSAMVVELRIGAHEQVRMGKAMMVFIRRMILHRMLMVAIH